MHAGGDPGRPEAVDGSERLRLHAAVVAAQEEAREIDSRLRRAEAELERTQGDLEAERHDRARDAEWFRDALAEMRSTADGAVESEKTADELRAALQETQDALAERDRGADELRSALQEAHDAIAERERGSDELHTALQEAHDAIAARDTLLAELRRDVEMRLRAESETLTALNALRERVTSLAPEAAPELPRREPAPPPAEPEAVADRGPEALPVPEATSQDPTAPAELTAAGPAPAPEPGPHEPGPPEAGPHEPGPPEAGPPEADPPEAAATPGSGRFDRRPPWPDGCADLPRAEIEWHAGYVNSQFRVVVYQPHRRRGSTAAAGSTFKWLLMGEPAPDAPEFVDEVQRLAAALELAGWEIVGEGAAWFSRRYVWRREEPPPQQLALGPLQASSHWDSS